ncbi:PREDICTED: ADP-ribosylation factor-like protein 2-binding protein [Ceratosolen solmsi marchali]|uniref:ADP-ribosylation factor-like protein 2-binding protein n=1 Tax=Ceratosolen solmsi marchali TaxID=326594 RepID=A0AAJ7DWU3_9HYME|nr:PREDICTED: ADP-ribosylation factor-like protein 2-binding protein [Ceratosolen solmsi marchali]
MTQEVMDSLFAISNIEIQESHNNEDISFDKIIGHIEDILMENEFQSIQQYFLDNYWNIFEPIEENKLMYMEIFNDYNKRIDNYITTNLKKIIPNFSMDDFINELHKRRSKLDGEVFEILLTFTDFLAFKDLLLDYRAVKEGKVQDLSSGILIKSTKM